MKKIHLNCDLGEGGEFDSEIMKGISACNIACGGHAGTVETMQETVRLALENEVEIGAHPSYFDKKNFGRISLALPPEELKRSLVAQILSLKQIAESEGGKLSHIKPHGALYHDAQQDERIAAAVIDAVLEFGKDFRIVTLENSFLAEKAKGKLEVVFEAFADRGYQNDGQLIPRGKSGAIVSDKKQVLEHLISMADKRIVKTYFGKEIPCRAQTFCLHSDTPEAVNIIRYLNQELPTRNFQIV